MEHSRADFHDTMSPRPYSIAGAADTIENEFVDQARALRPFYFNVVIWGARFRHYFLDFCLPSLLAPNNIPSLQNRGKNKFLICTTPEDWHAMVCTPIFKLLQGYVEPVFIHILAPTSFDPGYQHVHMGIGHKLATQMMYEDQAYAVILTPDFMLSDGSIAAIQRHAVAGKHVVLTAALRFGEEPLLEHLAAMGLCDSAADLGAQGKPLAITGRQLVTAGLKSFHSETLRYEWDTAYFSNTPSACWWRVPGEDGIVLHSLSWGPLLLDYAAVGEHKTTALEHWTFDGDYVSGNFTDYERVYVVQDSDEIMQVSWAPIEDRRQPLAPERVKALPILAEWVKGAIVRNAVLSPKCDALKRSIFALPVRWHTRELDGDWGLIEEKARATLQKYILEEELDHRGTIREVMGPNQPRGGSPSGTWHRVNRRGLKVRLTGIWLRRIPVALLYRCVQLLNRILRRHGVNART